MNWPVGEFVRATRVSDYIVYSDGSKGRSEPGDFALILRVYEEPKQFETSEKGFFSLLHDNGKVSNDWLMDCDNWRVFE